MMLLGAFGGGGVPVFLTFRRIRVVVFVAKAPNLPNIEVERCANTSKISLQAPEEETRQEGGRFVLLVFLLQRHCMYLPRLLSA